MYRFLVILALAGALAAPIFAQQGTAEITGRVADEQAGVLPGVTIVLTNEETGVFREVTSGEDGSYFVSQLTPGRYRLAARLASFKNFERRGLLLEVGKTLTINFTLSLGTLAESVTVTDVSPLVDVTSTEVGGNIGTSEITELPAPNRNLFAIVALLPGVQFSPSNQFGNDAIIASGQAAQGNNVTLDGGYNADDALGSSVGGQTRTALESVQEFQVLTNQYDAEFGRATGAVVNAVTKQGTNSFKGVVFGYFTNSKITAQDYFARLNNLEKPKNVMKQWGGTLGGPIVRNKAHFFGSLERLTESPGRAFNYTARPDLNFSTVENREAWNGMIRFDHQINANNTWAIRYLGESSPQIPIIAQRTTQGTTRGPAGKASFTDETDLDQTVVGTYTTVVGNERVNTVRVSATLEHWYHGSICWRGQGSENVADQSKCPPTLYQLTFFTQQSPEAAGPTDRNYQLQDVYSWFVPDLKGNHEFKVGTTYHYTILRRNTQTHMNGGFFFNTDLPFDPTNPRTYPERFTLRVGGPFNLNMHSHTIEAFAQDKWKISRRATLSLGVRYDLEVTPVDETDNPLFKNPYSYPVDKNNLSPRLGFTYAPDSAGKSVIRGGYGLFYGRTLLGTIESFFSSPKFSRSFEVLFPQDTVDPGPSRGQFPTDPTLVNGPVINRAYIDALYPAGTRLRNTGDVMFDSPNRRQPYTHQVTIGYQRQVLRTMSVSADYVKMIGRDMFLQRNLNPMIRANTSRTGPITRLDAFGVLGEPYVSRVWLVENTGKNQYDALNLQLEQRFSKYWSGRASYSLSSSRGTASAQADRNLLQVGTNLNLDQLSGPVSVDRRHILTLSGRVEIPKTHGVNLSATMRYMSGAPFTIQDTSVDADRNGELFDPLPAGTYSGTASGALQNVKYKGGVNGAYGPNFFQTDLRITYRHRLGEQRTVDFMTEIFNLSNYANFNNPSGDRRVTDSFLRPLTLRGGSGFPRQAQFGVRLAF
jgi:hypothetical protein